MFVLQNNTHETVAYCEVQTFVATRFLIYSLLTSPALMFEACYGTMSQDKLTICHNMFLYSRYKAYKACYTDNINEYVPIHETKDLLYNVNTLRIIIEYKGSRIYQSHLLIYYLFTNDSQHKGPIPWKSTCNVCLFTCLAIIFIVKLLNADKCY